jgi:hypothetical protein
MCRPTDPPITCGLRSRGFNQGIIDRRQVTRAARRRGPEHKTIADGGISNLPVSDSSASGRLLCGVLPEVHEQQEAKAQRATCNMPRQSE